MAEKIQFGNVVNATIQVNNLSDSTRKFDIAADLVLKNKAYSNVNAGTVCEKGETNPIAYFSADANGYQNVSFNNPDVSNVTILEAINKFITNASASATEITTETLL